MVALPNGTAAPEVPIEHSSLPPVVGINFGNSYASIAVFTKVSCSLAPRIYLAEEKKNYRKAWRNALPMKMESVKSLVLFHSMAKKS